LGDEANPKAQPVATLMFKPTLQRRGQLLEVQASREGERKFAWGFWGAVLSGGAFAALVLRTGASGFYELKMFAIALTLLALAGLSLYFGPTDTLERVHVLTIDPQARQITWRDEAQATSPHISLPFEEIGEVVFGIIYVPIDARHPNSRIHASTLLVRDARDQLIPVIAASTARAELFELAKLLSHHTRAPLTQVGSGVLQEG
jgi:hypothetical protein